MNFFDIMLAKKLDDMKDSEIVPLEAAINGTYQQAGKAYSPVVVNVPIPAPALDAKSITENGTYNASSDNLDGYSSVVVNVPSGGEDHETLNALIDRSITSITNESTSIGNSVFYSCTSLTTIDFPETINIGSSAFSSCTSLTTIDFPEAINIGSSAFSSCTSLTTIDFPKATTIFGSSFRDCTSLTTIDFPEATTISSNSFYNCTSLTTIDFPKATNIGSSAFKNCSALTSITFLNSTPPTLSNVDAFSGLPNDYVIYVPNGSLTAYQTATNWSTIASHIVELQA